MPESPNSECVIEVSILSMDKKHEILNDHYKDTFFQLREHLKLRDALFLGVLIIAALLFYQLYLPKEAGDAISKVVSTKLKLENTINVNFIGSVIWFALLGLTIRYFQTVVYIERLYSYIHKIEDQLCLCYDSKAFTRESKSYLENYPMFSTWTWALYTIVFPILLIIVASIKILFEVLSSSDAFTLLVFDLFIWGCIVISILLYLSVVHFKK
jgi:hypothetical protein